MRLYNNENSKSFRQKLRSDPPEPEKRLWYVIRQRQCHGVKFRRQCSIEKYIVDFFSFEKKLAIEIDGDSHYSKIGIAQDKKRDQFLKQQGITVIRFTNEEITHNLPGCFETLEDFLSSSSDEGHRGFFSPSRRNSFSPRSSSPLRGELSPSSPLLASSSFLPPASASLLFLPPARGDTGGSNQKIQ